MIHRPNRVEERSSIMIASSDTGEAGHRQGDRPQHLDIDPQIDAGGFQTSMSKQVANGLDADATPEKPHGKGMAQRVGRCPVEGETALPCTVVEDVDDA